MSSVGVARKGDLVIFNSRKLPDLFTMQTHKQMHHHKRWRGEERVSMWAAKTTANTTRNTGLRLQLNCAIISLPTFLIMMIKKKNQASAHFREHHPRGNITPPLVSVTASLLN